MIEAPASITCESCRARWAKYHDPTTGQAIIHSPIGYVKVFLSETTQPVICRSYSDLRNCVLPLALGSAFRLQLVAYMLTVGEGLYTRFCDGVAVSCEVGACEGLHLAMREAIPIDLPLQTP